MKRAYVVALIAFVVMGLSAASGQPVRPDLPQDTTRFQFLTGDSHAPYDVIDVNWATERFGMRMGGTEESLSSAMQRAFGTLRQSGQRQNANAVINIQVETTEVPIIVQGTSQGSRGIVVVTGTLVRWRQ